MSRIQNTVTFCLSPEALSVLTVVTRRYGIGAGEAFRRSLGRDAFLIDVAERGGRILVEIPGRPTVELTGI